LEHHDCGGGGDAEVLVVDDDADLRESVQVLLTLRGYRVRTAADGAEALAWLERADAAPCLTLIDLMMPVMDGFTLRARMCADPNLAAIPVVIITGAGVLATQRGAELRAPVLRKPVDLTALLATVASFCGERTNPVVP
jgi:CheY-like chemotaxis protein